MHNVLSRPNYIVEYYRKISSGEIKASKKVIKQYELLAKELENPKLLGDNWTFDIIKANRPIEFIENFCKKTTGSKAGKPVRLLLYQKAMIQAVYGFVDVNTGFRRCREFAVLQGRKNGKTGLSAFLALYHLVADREGSAEVYLVATKKDQAKKGFVEATHMVTLSEWLSEKIKKRKSDLYFEDTFSTLMALASDSNSLDGLNGSFFCLDEVHAYKDRNLYDVCRGSRGMREQPLLMISTTNGFIRFGIFDELYAEYTNMLEDTTDTLYNGKTLAFIYELDDEEEWDQEEMWIKANPSIDVIRSREDLQDEVKKAKVSIGYKRTVLTKYFNLVTQSVSAWLDFKTAKNTERFDIAQMGFDYGIGGVDLSGGVDLTSAKLLCMRADDPNIYVLSMYWLPEDLFDERCQNSERGNDNVPYKLWHEQGYLRLCKGKKIRTADITQWFLDIQDQYGIYLWKCGYDAWETSYWIDDMINRFGKNVMEPIRQGARTFSNPMKQLEVDFQSENIIYNYNPIDLWCFTNTEIKIDDNENIRPIKPRNKTKRIDGMLSLLDAYVVLKNNEQDYMNLL